MTVNRHHRVHDYLMKSARYLVNYRLTRESGTLVVGYHPDGKQNVHMSQRNNQNVVQIPHGPRRTPLENLCERYGWQ